MLNAELKQNVLIAIKYFQIQVHWQNIADFVKKQIKLNLDNRYKTVSSIAVYTFCFKLFKLTKKLKTSSTYNCFLKQRCN